jgi:hypothetical protein
MNETKQKLIINKSMSDENLHIPQEVNVSISDYIKKVKAQNKFRSQVLFKYF